MLYRVTVTLLTATLQAHDRAPADESAPEEEAARFEAKDVIRGGDRSSKEFP
jgi:hypothetical protein